MKKNYLFVILTCISFYGFSQDCKYDKTSDNIMKSITAPFRVPLFEPLSSQIRFRKIDTSYFIDVTYIKQDYKAIVVGTDNPVKITLVGGESFILIPTAVVDGKMDENVLNNHHGRTTITIPTRISLDQLKKIAAIGISKISFNTAGDDFIEEENKNKALNKNLMKCANCIMQ